MTFRETSLGGAFIIEIAPIQDERGFFARTWCRSDFASHGLLSDLAQCSVSYNRARGTIRGMHLQVSPHEETKLVHCLRGRIYDVVLDLRATSPTFGQWFATELSEDNCRQMYVPPGCAHGYQTLEDGSLVSYSISVPYNAASSRGVRWNDPRFQIEWPLSPTTLSAKDRGFADYATEGA